MLCLKKEERDRSSSPSPNKKKLGGSKRRSSATTNEDGGASPSKSFKSSNNDYPPSDVSFSDLLPGAIDNEAEQQQQQQQTPSNLTVANLLSLPAVPPLRINRVVYPVNVCPMVDLDIAGRKLVTPVKQPEAAPANNTPAAAGSSSNNRSSARRGRRRNNHPKPPSLTPESSSGEVTPIAEVGTNRAAGTKRPRKRCRRSCCDEGDATPPASAAKRSRRSERLARAEDLVWRTKAAVKMLDWKEGDDESEAPPKKDVREMRELLRIKMEFGTNCSMIRKYL